MEWTKEAPTQEGYYWAILKSAGSPPARPLLVEIRYLRQRWKRKKELIIFSAEINDASAADFSSWLGPVLPPRPPAS